MNIKLPITKAYSSEEYKLIIEDSEGAIHKWTNEEMEHSIPINFPIVEAEKSEGYGLIIKDSVSVYHYWNHDGKYDGHSMDMDKCIFSGTSIN